MLNSLNENIENLNKNKNQENSQDMDLDDEEDEIMENEEENEDNGQNNGVYEEVEVDKKLLLETLMSWTHPKQQEFLKSRSKAIYGIKTTCAARIMGFIGPEEAIKFINEYRKTEDLEESSE